MSLDKMADPPENPVLSRIISLPIGYSEVLYIGKKYGVSLMEFNGGKSFKFYAKAHNGGDVVSFNLYLLRGSAALKPCEMSGARVLEFINTMIPCND